MQLVLDSMQVRANTAPRTFYSRLPWPALGSRQEAMPGAIWAQLIVQCVKTGLGVLTLRR